MENKKKSNINKQILDKVYETDVSEGLKEFIVSSLEFEYDHIEESRVDYKKFYKKLVKAYSQD